MIVKFLRENLYASYGLLVLRLYLGYKWFTAGWGKVFGEEPFSAAGFMGRIVEKPVVSHGEAVYPTYNAFIENFAMPNAGLFSFLVSWGELLVGLGLILGALTTAAMFFGVMMNFMFMFGGTVSSNPWMVLLSIFILIAGANAGKIGLDRWILPYLSQLFKKEKDNSVSA